MHSMGQNDLFPHLVGKENSEHVGYGGQRDALPQRGDAAVRGLGGKQGSGAVSSGL